MRYCRIEILFVLHHQRQGCGPGTMALSLEVLAAATTSGWRSLAKLFALTVFLLLVLGVASKLRKDLSSRSFRAQHGCKPCRKFPMRDPILGLDFIITNIRAFRNHRFLELLSSRFREAGPTWEVRGFHRRSVFTADPENVKALLSLRFKDFTLGGRQRIMGPLLGQGVFASDGEEWAASRALLRPNFAREQVADLGLIEAHVARLFRLLPGDGAATVDLQPLFHRFTLDSATDFLFGKPTSTLIDARAEDLEFARALRYSLDHMAFLLIAGPLRRFWKGDPEFRRSNQVCRSYVDTFVDEVLAYKKDRAPVGTAAVEDGGIRRNSFLRDLASATDDKGKIRGELLSLLLAGRDTTASLLSSLFYHISRRPDVWAKLGEEVAALDGRRPTYAELRDLTYAKYCINEGNSASPCMTQTRQLIIVQHYGCTHQSQRAQRSPSVTRCSHAVAVRTENHQYTSRKDSRCSTLHTQCTAAEISGAPTPTTSGPSGGLARGIPG